LFIYFVYNFFALSTKNKAISTKNKAISTKNKAIFEGVYIYNLLKSSFLLVEREKKKIRNRLFKEKKIHFSTKN